MKGITTYPDTELREMIAWHYAYLRKHVLSLENYDKYLDLINECQAELRDRHERAKAAW